jgi:hypothetical protein
MIDADVDHAFRSSGMTGDMGQSVLRAEVVETPRL